MTTEVKNLTVSRILADKRKDIAKAIEKLMKKCERLGVKRPMVLYSEDYPYTFSTDETDSVGKNIMYSIDVFDLRLILPEEMKLGDWEAIAFIDYYDGSYIQFDIDKDYKYDFLKATVDATCEHCNSIRNRRKAFVLKSRIDGSFKKVGSTCVKDFTGVDPTKFFKAFQYMISTLEEFGSDWGDGNSDWGNYLKDYRVWDINHIWTVAKKVLDVEGSYVKTEWEEIDMGHFWKSIRTNTGDATADKVKDVLFDYDENNVHYVKPNAVDAELVTGIRNWLTLMTANNDFDSQLKDFAERKRVRTREIGLVGYVVEAYRKYVESLSAPVSNFVGTVGEKIKMEVTVRNIGGYEGGYGWTNIYKMVDANGNVFAKFGTINARYSDTDEVVAGSVLKMTGLITNHNEYKGKKETVLGRVSKY